ncbi:tRNA (N(6)-L-threonylcarbamoyladenosine(37)-C(2))-methylthiotransferase MtaB [Methylococcus sp. EFPC2]|uniref:tRNA (N(6)-L-threonylcarbamoyladenosine(37)-C(2))- methylthiotransferase MtaB n=1 Tax=Methylococcus sp. EFPC2 TaxID=2812648 RepID=UPI0019671861|nr:tRNA (N(6)-L-threonylcarbamoyladenosine(37)-C(2))-methylthiotransferase MtaB [Methylococcus sp. EFPC2]QSA98208.1 tRNA (N(6)-L-threonylcarbamoyladenosine(37)-C(2))-methylthiotransferase MtaB [Methylococcus sp. EFPC2]
MRVHLKTLGCRLNEAELETWALQLQAEGHHIVPENGEADLVVLNTCAVTQDAVRKSRNLIRRVHRAHPQAKLVVSGCYATLDPDAITQALGVDLVVSNADKARLIDIAKEKLDLRAMPAYSTEPGEASLFAIGRQRAFVKVQDGCRYRCTFCIVTVARGEESSRPIDEIVREVAALEAQGIQEVVLTGVHLGGWGADYGLNLEDLVRALLERTGIPRIRLGSVEPWELSDGLFELLAHSRLMPHLHLPLQSGSDAVLRRMARRCRTQEFAELAAKARAAVPDLNITTDIIVGFPGETEQEWEESLAFIEAMRFGHVHVFTYSIREGTKAATLPGQVDGAVKKARARVLHELAERHKRDTLARFVGRELPVLWEHRRESLADGRGRYAGYTSNYLKVEAWFPPGYDPSKRIGDACLTGLAESGDYLEAEWLGR